MLSSMTPSPVEAVKPVVEATPVLQPMEEVKLGPVETVADPFESLDHLLTTLEETSKLDDSTTKQEGPVMKEGEGLVNQDGVRPRRASSGSDASSEEEVTETTATADDLDISNVQPVNQDTMASKQAPKSTFYFYQDTSGQLIFLHALNIQMLVHEFGSLEMCPLTIRARIVEKDSSTMTEELRERLRYLRHLPVSSSFEVAELDLSAVIGQKTMLAFKDQIETRKRKRQRKQKAEKVREKRIRREEMRIMGRYPSPMARIESSYHYPRMGENVGEPAILPDSGSGNESVSSSLGSTGLWPGQGTEAASGGLNFASAMKKKVPASQSGGAPATRPQPTNKLVLLGGSMLAARPRTGSESEAEPEGYVPPPPAASLGDALAQALAQANKQATTTPPTKKKGKKTRGKGILLSG